MPRKKVKVLPPPPSPLSYDSTKHVLQYIRPEKRFEISRCCPALRKTEKLVPLHLGWVCFDEKKVYFDGFYQFGTYRHYETKYMQYLHPQAKKENDDGGVPYDLDEDGCEEESTEGVLLPGDVQVRQATAAEEERQELIVWKKRLKLEMQALEDRMKVESGGDVWQKRAVLHILRSRLEDKREIVLTLNKQINPHNILPPKETFIQLTIDKYSENTTYEHVKGAKLYEAEKYIISKLLGGRKLVFVEELQISRGCFTLRLPEGVKFKIKKFAPTGVFPIVYQSLKPIFHDSDHLDRLTVWDSIDDIEYFNHNIMKNAKKLSFVGSIAPNIWLQALSNLQHKTVRVHDETFTAENVIGLLRFWIDSRKEIGTCYTFSIRKEFIKESGIFKQVKSQFNARKIGQRSLEIGVDAGSHIEFSYKTGYFWKLEMKVVDSRIGISTRRKKSSR